MRIRIDYLNKDRQVRHIHTDGDELELWFEIITILKQWATDVRVYNLTK